MTRTQAVVVGATLAMLVVVALVAGLEQTPAIGDQPRQPEASPGPAAVGSLTSVVIALFTTAFGFVAFVIGQFVLKLVVDPIQEQARVVGNVAHALSYYRNVGPNDRTGNGPDRAVEAQRKYRDLAAELRMNLRVIRVIPFYRFFSRVGLVLPKEQVRRASDELSVLSHIAHKGSAADDVNRRRYTVEKSLGIDR